MHRIEKGLKSISNKVASIPWLSFDACAWYRGSYVLVRFHIFMVRLTDGYWEICHFFFVLFYVKPFFDLLFRSYQGCSAFYMPRSGSSFDKFRVRGLSIRASDDSQNVFPVAPVQFESPVGQLLAQILQFHPHLLPATVDQQLDNLQTERDLQTEEAPSLPQDPLYK